MPIIDANGRVLSENEVRQLVEVMQAQYKNVKLQVKTSESEEIVNLVCSEYDKRIEALESDYLTKMKSEETISMDSILYNELRTTTKNVLTKVGIKKYIEIDARYDNATEQEQNFYGIIGDLFSSAYTDIGDPEILQLGNPSSKGEELIGPENAPDAFEKTVESFEFATEPIEGIEDIIPYNPNSDSTAGILEQRAGNSTTLKWTAEKVKTEQDNLQIDFNTGKIDKETYEQRMSDIDQHVRDRELSMISLSGASTLTRMKASELMNKSSVSCFDVFNIFSEINMFVNEGNKDNLSPGTLRGKGVQAGGIYGVGVANVASDMFKTCQMIADCINDIKAETDPVMQKTHAVQLAAFTYQLTLSEHLFNDGNGRSCRMLSDAILESFGLPPHIPTPEEQTIAATIGEPLDYKKGADVFFNGIKKSSDALKALKKDETVKKKSAGEMPKGRAHKSYKVTDKLANDLKTLKTNAQKAKGTFRDSEQYKRFLKAVDVAESLADAIKDAAEKGTAIDKTKLGSAAKSLVDAVSKGKDLSVKAAQRIFDESLESVAKFAKQYVDYKLKDHTVDKASEPNKKALNSDDIAKLKVMKSVLGNTLGTGKEVKLPEENKVAEAQTEKQNSLLQ